MRILVLHHFYAVRGGENVVVESEVDALRARGHSTVLLSTRAEELPLGGAAHLLLVAANPFSAARLERALDEHRPDVVHVHNLFPGWGASALQVLIRRRQIAVQTLHNARYLCPVGTQVRAGARCTECAGGDYSPAIRYGCFRDSSIQSGFYALALARIHASGLVQKAFARIICVSHAQREVHAAAGFPREQLVVRGHFAAMPPEARDPEPGWGLFAGRVEREKGFDVLGEAMLRAPGIRLRVAGDGSARRRWERVLGDRVEWLGWLSRERVAHELGRAAFGVMPSLAESFGLFVLEAFANGRPVVASDAGGLRELVSHEVTGLVSPAGEVDGLAANLTRFVDQPELARTMGARARQVAADEHSERVRMEQLEQIYQGILAAPAVAG